MSILPSLRLIYFPVRARAECARMILAYGGIPYKEEDCSSYFGQTFQEVKAAGKLPLGQLPVLDVSGQLLCQSGAINRYLAELVTKPGFVPKDLLVRAHCDMVHETAQELAKVNPIVNIFTGEKFREEKEEFFSTILPSRLAGLVSMLDSQQYFCGELVTYCDFAVYHCLDLVRLLEPSVVEREASLLDWMGRVEGLEGVEDYLAARPKVREMGESK